jgi:hypothetical protein
MMGASTICTTFSSWPRRRPSTTSINPMVSKDSLARSASSVPPVSLRQRTVVVDGRRRGHDEKWSVLAKVKVQQFAISLHHCDCIESDHLSKSTVRIRPTRTSARLLSNSFQVSSSYGIFANSRASFVPALSPAGSAGNVGSFATLCKISRTSASRLTPRASARCLSRATSSSDKLRIRNRAIGTTSDFIVEKQPIAANIGAAT